VELVEQRLFLLKPEGVSSAATSPARRGYTLELIRYDLSSLPQFLSFVQYFCICIWILGLYVVLPATISYPVLRRELEILKLTIRYSPFSSARGIAGCDHVGH